MNFRTLSLYNIIGYDEFGEAVEIQSSLQERKENLLDIEREHWRELEGMGGS